MSNNNCRFLLLAMAMFTLAAPTQAMLIRTVDGSGNNTSGQAGEALMRLSGHAYEADASTPRGGATSRLPNPRVISNAVAAQRRPVYNARNATDWLWQWGQFLDHDLDLTPTGGESFNITVPSGDEFFTPGTEIAMRRSVFQTDAAGVRQQTNAITAFIDGSNVYGSDPDRAAFLRNDEGYLRMSTGLNGEILMGLNTDLPNDAPAGADPTGFFLAGDVRANEQIGLTAVHTLFAREHNRLADRLKTRLAEGDAALIAERNASIDASGNGVDDEGDFIYQAARRLVGAQIQKITYTEFLPVLLGVDLTAGATAYDPAVLPGISTEFSTAAYRFGHTMLSPVLLRVDDHGAGRGTREVALRDAFFNPADIMRYGVDSLLLGLSRQRAQAIDNLLVDDVRNFLFGPPGGSGLDLASLNIQRGRDHGIADLNTVRAALGLAPYVDFTALTGGDPALAAALERLYGDINSVDLWVGGLAEIEDGMSMLGGTFSHIIRDQFERLMRGDRFFYLNDLATLQVLDERFAESTTLARLIRRNSDITRIQANVFLFVPEPGTLVLSSGAIAGLLFRISRRKRHARCGGGMLRVGSI